jgi:hypothetical protein
VGRCVDDSMRVKTSGNHPARRCGEEGHVHPPLKSPSKSFKLARSIKQKKCES